MLHNIFFCIFDQINEGLMSKIYAMFKNIKMVMSKLLTSTVLLYDNRKLAWRKSITAWASQYLKLSSYYINTCWYLLVKLESQRSNIDF